MASKTKRPIEKILEDIHNNPKAMKQAKRLTQTPRKIKPSNNAIASKGNNCASDNGTISEENIFKYDFRKHKVTCDCFNCHIYWNGFNDGEEYERERIKQFIENERDNGNMGSVNPYEDKIFSASLCLSNLLKFIEEKQ